MGTYHASLLADLFFHSLEVDFKVDLIQKREHRLDRFLEFYILHAPLTNCDEGCYRH